MKRLGWFLVWTLTIGWLMYEASRLWPTTKRYELWVDGEQNQFILDTSTGQVVPLLGPKVDFPVEKPDVPMLPKPDDCPQPCPNQNKSF